MKSRLISALLALVGFALLILAWEIAALISQPILVPPPWQTLETAYELLRDGILIKSIFVSFGRILGGWLLGGLIGIPLGLLMGTSAVLRAFWTPYVEGLRYIPPIA